MRSSDTRVLLYWAQKQHDTKSANWLMAESIKQFEEQQRKKKSLYDL